MEKVKFIKVNENAHPIVHDGFGYQFVPIDIHPVAMADGQDYVFFFTGYKISIPEGYIGQFYDLQVAHVLTVERVLGSQFIDHNWTGLDEKYPEYGFGIWYRGLARNFRPNLQFGKNPLFGISVFKKQNISDFEVTTAIIKPKQQQGNPQQLQQKQQNNKHKK